MRKRRIYKPRPERIPNEYRSLNELPELMTVYDVADVLHVSVASAYTVTDMDDFPVFLLNRFLLNSQRRIQRERFIQWLLSKERRNGTA